MLGICEIHSCTELCMLDLVFVLFIAFGYFLGRIKRKKKESALIQHCYVDWGDGSSDVIEVKVDDNN